MEDRVLTGLGSLGHGLHGFELTGPGSEGFWVTGFTGLHRRSRRRRPLVSSAPPTGGSDSSLNSPDLISLSASLGLSLSCHSLCFSPPSVSSTLSAAWVEEERTKKKRRTEKEK
jgi:hypothetical protein